MKPFVLLATRAEDLPADEEYALFLRYTGLSPDELVRVRLESEPMPRFDLDELSGIFVGGGPFNASDPLEKKSAVQRRVEAEFASLLDEVVARDFPFLGACYGIGTLGAHQNAVIDRTYPEPISIVPVTTTEAGASDPLLAGMPTTFDAFVGHKEAISQLPDSATLLASSDVVSLHVPLTPGTRGMLGAAELDRMRPGSLLVDVARGGIVDERALDAVLRDPDRGPAVAALDVFEAEGDRFTSPLVGNPHAILTPHVAGMTAGAMVESSRRLVAAFARFLRHPRPRRRTGTCSRYGAVPGSTAVSTACSAGAVVDRGA